MDAALCELAGEVAPVGEVTFAAYAEKWLARRTVRSAEDERKLWASHVGQSSLACMPVVEIRRRHIRDFLAVLSAKKKLAAKRGGCQGERRASADKLSYQTCKLVFALIRRILNEAIVDEIIANNPAQGHRMVKPDEDASDKWTFLSAEEIDVLLTCEKIPEAVRWAYAVAIYTGVRAGELWGLRWGDLDLDRGECTIRRSYAGPTKASKVRRFPLLAPALDALRQIKAASTDTRDTALVFPSPRGGGYYSKGWDASWARKYREAAGIRREAVFHSFRHTCASHLLAGTWGHAWSLSEVRDYLGHSSIAVTERYAHLAPGRLAELVKRTSGGTVEGTGRRDENGEVQRRETGEILGAFLNSRSAVRDRPRSLVHQTATASGPRLARLS